MFDRASDAECVTSTGQTRAVGDCCKPLGAPGCCVALSLQPKNPLSDLSSVFNLLSFDPKAVPLASQVQLCSRKCCCWSLFLSPRHLMSLVLDWHCCSWSLLAVFWWSLLLVSSWLTADHQSLPSLEVLLGQWAPATRATRHWSGTGRPAPILFVCHNLSEEGPCKKKLILSPVFKALCL